MRPRIPIPYKSFDLTLIDHHETETTLANFFPGIDLENVSHITKVDNLDLKDVNT